MWDKAYLTYLLFLLILFALTEITTANIAEIVLPMAKTRVIVLLLLFIIDSQSEFKKIHIC